MSEEHISESVYIACARARAAQIGNRSTEEQILEVSRRPWFRAVVETAHRHGWMDALIHLEEERGSRKRRS